MQNEHKVTCDGCGKHYTVRITSPDDVVRRKAEVVDGTQFGTASISVSVESGGSSRAIHGDACSSACARAWMTRTAADWPDLPLDRAPVDVARGTADGAAAGDT